MAGAGFNVKLEGFDELLKVFQKAPEVVKDNFKVELESAAKEIQEQAKLAAPVGLAGTLRNMIAVDPPTNDGLTWSVTARANYSAYVEFGTGTRVSIAVDDDVRAYEETFKTGKETTGMYAHPFLFPAVFRQTPLLLEALKKSLQKALSKT